MSRNTVVHSGHQSQPQSVLSPRLQSYVLDRGRQSAMGLPEHAAIAEYVQHQIAALVADYAGLPDDQQAQLLALWSTGFQRGIRERVQCTVRNHAFILLTKDHSGLLPDMLPDGPPCSSPDSVQSIASALADDERAAAHTPIVGTLHLPRRGVK